MKIVQKKGEIFLQTDNPGKISRPHANKLYMSMRLLLCFGKICGFLPISGLFSHNVTVSSLKIRKRGITGLVPVLVIFALVALTWMAFTEVIRNDKEIQMSDIITSLDQFFYCVSALFLVLYLYQNSDQLISCFHRWEESEITSHLEDNRLHLVVNFWVICAIFSAFTENTLSNANVAYFRVSENDYNSSFILNYYKINFEGKYLSKYIPYTPAFGAAYVLANHWAWYTSTLGDIMISVFAVLTYNLFRAINKDAINGIGLKSASDSKTIWMTAVRNYMKFENLLEDFNKFLSPVILVTSVSNVYMMGTHIHWLLRSHSGFSESVVDGLDETSNVLFRAYRLWSLLYISLKTFGTFILCSRINDTARRFAKFLSKCPAEMLTKEIERTEMRIRTEAVGFGGLEYFTITKPFILNVLNVICSIEIVLLQAST